MPIRIEEREGYVLIIIDREEKANSLDVTHLKELALKLREACENNESRLTAIIGVGKYFSAGIDLTHVVNPTITRTELEEAVKQALKSILYCEKPVMSLVNGYALGLGFELLTVSDLTAAVRDAKIGLTAVRMGLVPPLSPFLGDKRLYKLALTGEVLSGIEAYRLGLLDWIARDRRGLLELASYAIGLLERTEPASVSRVKKMRAGMLEPLVDEGVRILVESMLSPEARRRASRFLRGTG